MLSRASSLLLNKSQCCSTHVFKIFRQAKLRTLSTSACAFQKKFNFPVTAGEMPRAGGLATMMRLPHEKSAAALDACFVGIPFDSGTSNKTGTRFGPRQIRAESSLLRPYNETGASPFESMMVADVGDIPVNSFSISKTVDIIHAKMGEIVSEGCRPLTLGGDHTISYPILKAIKDKYGPVGMIHVDAHADTGKEALPNEPIYHGSPFYLAAQEGLLDCKRVVQIGLRGTAHGRNAYENSIDLGFRIIPARDCRHKSLAPLMSEVRQQMGEGPVYISFDIDALDPSCAPGTGTPEIGGLTSIQALEIIEGCWGLNIVGGDLVEVSPPYDTTGITALTAANLLFEMLCILPGVK